MYDKEQSCYKKTPFLRVLNKSGSLTRTKGSIEHDFEEIIGRVEQGLRFSVFQRHYI